MVQQHHQHHHRHHQNQSHHQHQVSEYAETKPTLQDEGKYSDAASLSSSSSSSPRKPLTSFETNDDLDEEFLDLEDGYIPSTKGDRYWTGKAWWGAKDIMTVRSRRKGSVDSSVYRDEGKTLLDARYTRRRRRSWFNYCIFGGISGLSILAILLTTNLLLALATLYWTTDPDDVFTHWGGLNSGTEGLNWYPTDFTRNIQPIPCHSHNDYWRRIPLFSALRHGCTGVEADVWLFNDDLFVGHNTASLTPNRTFTSLYIDPLVRILENQNPNTDFYNGTTNGVFDVDPAQTLTLLIDVKTSGAETWPWILKQLEPLRERGWLSFVDGEVVHTRPITVVGTGNTRFDILTQNETYRDAFFDAPLDTMWEPRHTLLSSTSHSSLTEDDDETQERTSSLLTPSESTSPSPENHDLGQGLSGTTPTSKFTTLNSYYASVSLHKAIGRIWRGRLSDAQMAILRGQIRGAHSRGLKARYWDLPAWPLGLRNHVWDVLIKEGMDVLNVDDLRGASRLAW
ncbi:hypothetical protein BKA61DRAFT_502163 [Leptodontidium sp. MPI-SDFR-AT-0119]|nr:hypothetical protein BKA61DRAFT_502163 [Leptodontidium sp. MPI-SDFR-AT-0119]